MFFIVLVTSQLFYKFISKLLNLNLTWLKTNVINNKKPYNHHIFNDLGSFLFWFLYTRKDPRISSQVSPHLISQFYSVFLGFPKIPHLISKNLIKGIIIFSVFAALLSDGR